MLKARNIILIFCLNYLFVVFACLFVETAILSQKAALIQNTITVAADMALEQVQVSDDFFTTDGYGLNNAEYKIKAPTVAGNEYVEVNMFQALTGKSTRDSIFREAFTGSKTASEFNSWARKASGVKSMTAKLSPSGGINWYYIPKVLQIGTEILPMGSSELNRVNMMTSDYKVGPTASSVSANDFVEMYGWQPIAKGGSINGVDATYYLTPISLGLTYINSDYVNKLFINNMDLLMRSQYSDLTEYEGMVGTEKGNAYYSLIDTTSMAGDMYNPINNGIYTLLRGSEDTVSVGSAGTVSLYNGLKPPKIEYKVIDMYDNNSDNEDLLLMLFGKDANYLKSSSERAKSLPNGTLAKENRFIVAKVTFYAHIIVPFSTIISKEFRGMADDSGNLATLYLGTFGNDVQSRSNNGTRNFLDLNMWKTGTDDDYEIEYTRFFAVAP